ncbi:MAG: hypothetical protein OCC49_10840 [Fibrobacterales bacterium]
MKLFKHAWLVAAVVVLCNCSNDGQTSPEVSENGSSSENEQSSIEAFDGQSSDAVESSDISIDESSEVGGDPINTESSEETIDGESSEIESSSGEEISSVQESSSTEEISSSVSSSSDNESSSEELESSSSLLEAIINNLGDSVLVIDKVRNVLNIDGIIIEGVKSIQMDKNVTTPTELKNKAGEVTKIEPASHEKRFNLMTSSTRPPLGFVSYYLPREFPYEIQIQGHMKKSPYTPYKQKLYLINADKKLYQVSYQVTDVGQYILFYRTDERDSLGVGTVTDGTLDYSNKPWRVRYQEDGTNKCRDTLKPACADSVIESVEAALIEADEWYDTAEPLSSSSTTSP